VVSTIIPAYNAGAYVDQAVTSALNQRDVDSEVIVIDDGSTDNTWEILQRFSDRVRAVRQTNAGHVRSRNRGAQLARGEWLAFLDADDEWLPDKLAKQLNRADENTGLVYTDRVNFGDIERVSGLQSTTIRQFEGNVFEQLLFNNFITVSSVVMRKSWFDRLGGFDPELLVCEDWDLWLRFTACGGVVKLCPEPLTRYRWHATSMTNNQRRMCEGRLKVVRRALATERGQRTSRATCRRALSNAWACSAWYAAVVCPWTAARWYFWAASYWPFNMQLYKGMLKCLLRMP
jgi:glycosyltransferase involved in cell wall biosynthesis